MATSSRPEDIFARAVAKSGSTNTAWMPRPMQMSHHQATLTRVDTFNGIVDLQLPDPAAPLLQAVRYIRPYTENNLPTVGDVVHMIHTGTDVLVLGQHVILNGFVTL